MLNELSKEIVANNRAKGFYDEEDETGKIDIPKRLMLTVSELSEAMEADRDNNRAPEEAVNIMIDSFVENGYFDKVVFESSIKNTFEDEIADSIIRLLDLAGAMDIDIDWHVRNKLAYNKTRPHKHGRRY